MTSLNMTARTLPAEEPAGAVGSENTAELTITITRKDGTVEEISGIPVTFQNEELNNG